MESVRWVSDTGVGGLYMHSVHGLLLPQYFISCISVSAHYSSITRRFLNQQAMPSEFFGVLPLLIKEGNGGGEETKIV